MGPSSLWKLSPGVQLVPVVPLGMTSEGRSRSSTRSEIWSPSFLYSPSIPASPPTEARASCEGMSRHAKVPKKAPVVKIPPSPLADLPQSVFALVLLHLFEMPLQSARDSISNLMLVSRRLCQMTSQVLALRVAATTSPSISTAAAPSSAFSLRDNANPLASVTLDNEGQLCDEVLHGSLEVLRVRRMTHELAIREFYLKLPRAVRNWFQPTRAEMTNTLAKSLDQKLQADLLQWKEMRCAKQQVKQDPTFVCSIHDLIDQIAHLREQDHIRTDPILRHALLLIRRLRCETLSPSADWLQKCRQVPAGAPVHEFHTLVRIDIPWEEVLASMAIALLHS
ncbi:hypothetical protein PAPYR_7914 [Paratrimastix pyriformis]|uniref:F-box domain-containing protein n=1 Tax=Paratrimastix pyriformis TaxID=342808 RepID=A0ABQ8UHG7_9EUKA|nr:hypothetical protein PAPYR_7914 [Paratrimastix pyriformis]